MISNDKLTLLEVYVELVDEVVHPTYGKNILVTFWNNTEFDLSKGLDFQSNLTASAKICQYHLEHKEFNLGFKSVRGRNFWQKTFTSITIHISLF